jgi:hypothetical protein
LRCATAQADHSQYQRIKARALEIQREKEYELKRELARKAEHEKKAAKEEEEVSDMCEGTGLCEPCASLTAATMFIASFVYSSDALYHGS